MVTGNSARRLRSPRLERLTVLLAVVVLSCGLLEDEAPIPVTGEWAGMQTIQFEGDDYTVTWEFDLRQAGTSVSGSFSGRVTETDEESTGTVSGTVNHPSVSLDGEGTSNYDADVRFRYTGELDDLVNTLQGTMDVSTGGFRESLTLVRTSAR